MGDVDVVAWTAVPDPALDLLSQTRLPWPGNWLWARSNPVAFARMFGYYEGMFPADLHTAHGALQSAVDAMRAGGATATADELRDALRASHSLMQLAAQLQVETVAALQRNGVFAAAGYRRPESAVANLLTIDRGRAREITTAAARVCARVDLQGQELPAVLAGTAAAFAAGTASLAHVTVVAQLMDTAAARRLPPQMWAAVEEQIAAMTGEYTPGELRTWGTRLIDAYDQDGPEPDHDDHDHDQPARQVNELRLTPLPGGGGVLKGRCEDPARWAVIATVIDAKSAPLTAHDDRSSAERQADALADVCGYVADHGTESILPSTGGQRPHVTVTVQLSDLENRARAACLDFGGTPDPAALSALCCDAAVIPVVLNGAGQPLDVGRARRTIPEAIRRAVTARDRGCAHPGCDRPPSWSEIHHIQEWSRGGATRLGNLIMLCKVHHREIHSTEWIVRIAGDGIPEFIPPPWLDKSQTPRRHPRTSSRVHPTTGPPGRRPPPGPVSTAGRAVRNRTLTTRQ